MRLPSSMRKIPFLNTQAKNALLKLHHDPELIAWWHRVHQSSGTTAGNTAAASASISSSSASNTRSVQPTITPTPITPGLQQSRRVKQMLNQC